MGRQSLIKTLLRKILLAITFVSPYESTRRVLIFYNKAGAGYGGYDTRMAPIISLHMGTAIDRDTMGRIRRGINHCEDRARYMRESVVTGGTL